MEKTSLTSELSSSKPLGEQLRDALNLYGWHLSWCKKLAQMPMEPGRTYLWPKDDKEWRSAQPCTCKWDEVANTLVRSTDETDETRCYGCHRPFSEHTVRLYGKTFDPQGTLVCPSRPALKANEIRGSDPHDGKTLCPPESRCSECWPENANEHVHDFVYADLKHESCYCGAVRVRKNGEGGQP
jgi:hypothetical protein